MSKPIMETIEQACCPNCESVIDRKHVFINFDQQATGLERRVRVYCVHCDAGWQARHRLRAGIWTDETPAQQLTGRDLEGLRKRVEHVDHVIRHEALSA